MRALVVFEAVSVLAFGVLSVVALRGGDDAPPAIDVASLVSGPADEEWTGIFLQGQHVGYAVTRQTPTRDGGRVYQQEATFSLNTMGATQQVVTAGTALVDAEGRLVRFDFLLSTPVTLVGHGEVQPGNLHLDVNQGGTPQSFDLPLARRPALAMTLDATLRAQTLAPGVRFDLPYFDPVTMGEATMKVEVQRPETLPDGETGWWLKTSVGGMETRRLVDADGRTLREESALGLSSMRMTREDATKVDVGDPPDLTQLARVKLDGWIDPSTSPDHLVLDVEGVDPERIPVEPGRQARDGARVTIDRTAAASWPSLAIAGTEENTPTPSLQSSHPEIVARARQVVGDAPDRREAARRLHDFVHGYVAKVPTIGVPNGLDTLRQARGDCNEHTALFVSLARAVGIPARIAAGLAWNAELGQAFYYHAWAEVKMGEGEGGWVAIDPTFGQFPADAAHLKLVTGDLDRQMEIMGVMGRIGLRVVEAR